MRQALYISSKHLIPPGENIPVKAIADLVDCDIASIAFLVIAASDWQSAYLQLQQIRGFTRPAIYLKPILFLGDSTGMPRDIMQAADGWLTAGKDPINEQLETWAARLEIINARIDSMIELSSDGDSKIAFKVLRFIQSRSDEFKPLPTARMTSGYIYPKLQPFFVKDDIGVIETLDYLESRKLIAGTFVSRCHSCTHCGCAFLNFFETCPDCGASDLYNEELLHHFKCAYVGELTDYRQGTSLICPKCDTPLKHIGVDYDKASVIYHCRSCSKIFQDPTIMTACYDCWRETAPEDQLIRDIKSFSITSLGDNAARFGMESLFEAILASRVHITSYEVFREFFRIEKARILRYKLSTSCLAILRIDGIDQIYGKLGKRAQELFVELSEEFRTGLRNSDVFSVKNETLFLTLLTETSEKKSENAMVRLEKRITELLETNLKMGFIVHFTIQPLSAETDLEGCIETFLQSHAA